MLDSFSELPQSIAKLLTERANHTAAVVAIDKTLAHVSTALSGNGLAKTLPAGVAEVPVKKIGSPTKIQSAANGQTANEFVLEFIKEKKSPTSREINDAWKAAGRNRNADITLSLLTKAKKLKRTPLGEGIRGSRYSLAG